MKSDAYSYQHNKCNQLKYGSWLYIVMYYVYNVITLDQFKA
jgi:hypothetical protein